LFAIFRLLYVNYIFNEEFLLRGLMKNYKVIITYTDVVDVPAESEEQAIAIIKAQIPPRTLADLQVAQEAIIEEIKEN
jgi:hypothetical protein